MRRNRFIQSTLRTNGQYSLWRHDPGGARESGAVTSQKCSRRRPRGGCATRLGSRAAHRAADEPEVSHEDQFRKAASQCRTPQSHGFHGRNPDGAVLLFRLVKSHRGHPAEQVCGVTGVVFRSIKRPRKNSWPEPKEDSLNDGPSCPAFSRPGAIAGFRVNIDNNFPANEAGVANLAV